MCCGGDGSPSLDGEPPVQGEEAENPKGFSGFRESKHYASTKPRMQKTTESHGVPIIFYLPPPRPRFMLHLLLTQGLTQMDHILQGLRSRSPLASSASRWVCQWDFWHETRKQEDRCGFSFPLLCFIPDCQWRLYFFKSLAWDRWSLICESTTHGALELCSLPPLVKQESWLITLGSLWGHQYSRYFP